MTLAYSNAVPSVSGVLVSKEAAKMKLDDIPAASIRTLQVFDDLSYVTKSNTTLVLKEKFFSFSIESFKIRDSFGTNWFRCKGRAFRDKKVIMDAKKDPIYMMKEELFSATPGHHIYPPKKDSPKTDHHAEAIFKVTGNHSSAEEARLHTTVYNRLTEKHVALVVRGRFSTYDATVCIKESLRDGDETVIARIHRPKNKGRFFGKQEYHVDIEAGIDAAMIIALCMCFESQSMT